MAVALELDKFILRLLLIFEDVVDGGFPSNKSLEVLGDVARGGDPSVNCDAAKLTATESEDELFELLLELVLLLQRSCATSVRIAPAWSLGDEPMRVATPDVTEVVREFRAAKGDCVWGGNAPSRGDNASVTSMRGGIAAAGSP